MWDYITIKHEPQVRGYVCNHYPPFPETESGENVTEAYFLRNYAVKFFKARGCEIHADDISQMIKSGIVRKVLKDKKSQNYTLIKTQNVCILKICV